uniref:Uncharacterized protein n=1 Tax=Lepeophtheirus salmonis TaxID=72036 RepID=A0A0K2TV44_LEPSM
MRSSIGTRDKLVTDGGIYHIKDSIGTLTSFINPFSRLLNEFTISTVYVMRKNTLFSVTN